MAKKSNSVKREPTIDDIINEIKSKSEGGDYIYRGERKEYDNVSSALYREYFENEDINVDFEYFDLRAVQRGMLSVAKKHVGKPPQGLFEDFTERPIRSRYINYTERRLIIDSEEN